MFEIHSHVQHINYNYDFKMSEEGISEGKKAIEAEVQKWADEVGLESISCIWLDNGKYYYLTAYFGDYKFEWPFSKVQLEEAASGDIGFYITSTLRRNIKSLIP